MQRAAVFLDRDGTLIEDTGYIKDPLLVRVLPSVAQALMLFQEAGFERIVVSNQSGIARGYVQPDELDRVGKAVEEALAREGASLDAVYYCRHLDNGCACRKPLPGLIMQAASERNLDLRRSVMIGDRGSDIAAGQAAGIPTILVTTGPLVYDGPKPDLTVSTLLAAAEWVISRV